MAGRRYQSVRKHGPRRGSASIRSGRDGDLDRESASSHVGLLQAREGGPT